MTHPTPHSRLWRSFYQSIVVALCVWAGLLAGTGTHAAEQQLVRQVSALAAPDDGHLGTVIETALSVSTVRADSDRGSLKPLYFATAPPSQTRLGWFSYALEQAASSERYVYHACCVAQAGGTRAPPTKLPLFCFWTP